MGGWGEGGLDKGGWGDESETGDSGEVEGGRGETSGDGWELVGGVTVGS